MFRHFLVAIVLSIAMIGCSDRIRGPTSLAPQIQSERPSIPSDDQVLADLRAAYGEHLPKEIVSEFHDIESHMFIVMVETDTGTPLWFKVEYYFIDDEWIFTSEDFTDRMNG